MIHGFRQEYVQQTIVNLYCLPLGTDAVLSEPLKATAFAPETVFLIPPTIAPPLEVISLVEPPPINAFTPPARLLTPPHTAALSADAVLFCPAMIAEFVPAATIVPALLFVCKSTLPSPLAVTLATFPSSTA